MKPVVIIGGGPAGIASAVYLAARGVKIILIERNVRLGGRAASFFYSRMGEEIDYGQHVLMRCCTRTIDLLKLLGQESSISFQASLWVPMTDGGKKDAIASSPLPGVLHLLPSLLTYSFLSMRARMSVMRSGLSLLLKDPEDVPFGKWLASHGQREREISTLWDPICVATLNAHAESVSARMARVVFQRGFFRKHGADIGLFIRPLSQIFTSVIPFIEARQGRVLIRTSVKRIIVDAGCVRGVETSDGESIEADAVISAVSLCDLPALLPTPVEEDPFFKCLSGIDYAPIVNVHLWFDRQVMGESFIIGVDSPVQAIFDVSGAHHDSDKHHVVISQSAAATWIDLPVASIVDGLLSGLINLLPRARDANLIDSLVIKSRFATFVPAPGVDALRPTSTTPIKGLFLSGDYTATGWPSTIEGAVRSGFAAAAGLVFRR